MAVVSCVSVGLRSASELHVLGALVSSVSLDRWSRLDFVGDFVGASPPGRAISRKRRRPTDYEFDPALSPTRKIQPRESLTSGFSPQRHPTLRNGSQSVAGPMRDTSRAGLGERRESSLLCIRTRGASSPTGLLTGTTAGALLWGEGPNPEFPSDTAGPTGPGPRVANTGRGSRRVSCGPTQQNPSGRR
jgi:hypothetical protein